MRAARLQLQLYAVCAVRQICENTMNGITKIIGAYYTDGIDIYKHLKDGRWKRLRPLARDCFVLTVNSKRYYGTRAKMIWCAEHKVSPDAVDAKFAFQMVDGKMRDVRIDYNEKVKASWQDYDYIERFAHLAKAHLQGDKTAASELWQMLSSERNDLLAYAMSAAGGGCGKQRAEELADAAIMRVFEQTISGRRAIPSPRASMRTEIRKKIILKRDEDKFNIEIESAIVDSEGHCKGVRRLDHR